MANTSIKERRAARRDMMLNGNLFRVIPIIAAPMIISMVIDSLYNMADTYFVSQLGILATAAVGVNDSLLHLLRSIALAFAYGAASPISKLLGAKREEEACRVASTSIITCVMLLTGVAAVMFAFRESFVVLLGATEGARPYAVEYATFILLSAPVTAAEVNCSHTLRAEGSTTYSMFGMVSGCVINCVLDPLFINVLNMGVGGAALATTISKTISLVILLAPFLRGKTLIELKFKYFTPKAYIYKEITKMGIPAFLRSFSITFASVFVNNIARGFGDIALASVSVSQKCTRLIGSAIMGFGQGLQPIGGYCWGARRYKRVRQAFWTCTAIGLCMALTLGILMFIFAPQVLSVFMKEGSGPETLTIGTIMLRTQCVTLFPHVWIMLINGLYQALGRAGSATFMGLSRQVICLIPMVYLLSKLFGISGLAHAQAAADLLALIIAIPMVISQMNVIKKLNDGDEPPAGYGLSKAAKAAMQGESESEKA